MRYEPVGVRDSESIVQVPKLRTSISDISWLQVSSQDVKHARYYLYPSSDPNLLVHRQEIRGSKGRGRLSVKPPPP